MNYYIELEKDIRFREGLNACLNCGICTAICPAAEFYNYDPRLIITIVQQKNNEKIEELLQSETIWYCGQCMSCKTRCPRGNTPGFVIQALRYLSQKCGFFADSEKGRQQYAIKKTVGENILKTGYCIHPDLVTPDMHPEQGPIWEWVLENRTRVYERFYANLDKQGAGTLRKIHQKNLDELASIFSETGGNELYNDIERFSEKQASNMNLSFTETFDNDYFRHVCTYNSGNHSSE
ncbi:MAG: 4Fe-4S dicluster domain-containing protein [Bacteroidales bacterium]|jgi:heterodisulfide reductase subunit C|nr:4Fe-4S dicluster domain-containing protein [Bacteroidales bacterium]